jgi:pimeloyl-ACP methyl ester carboxylesterase
MILHTDDLGILSMNRGKGWLLKGCILRSTLEGRVGYQSDLTTPPFENMPFKYNSFDDKERNQLMSTDPIHQVLQLKDGRQLGFAEFGELQGKPLFFFHGQPGSRLGGRIFDDAARRLGIRIICPDRPGYGLSDLKPGRSLLDWADDVLELAGHLHLERFSVLGFSGGGPYSLVCAYAIPQRLQAATFVSGVGPAHIPGLTQGMSLPNRMLINAVRLAPFLAEIPFRSMRNQLKVSQDKVYTQLVATASPADRALMEHAATREHFLEDLKEGLRPGTRGVAWEVILFTRPWGFRFEDIHTPVILWQGLEDVNTPLAMGRYLAETIPGCQSHFMPGEGHQSLLIHQMDDILRGKLK